MSVETPLKYYVKNSRGQIKLVKIDRDLESNPIQVLNMLKGEI